MEKQFEVEFGNSGIVVEIIGIDQLDIEDKLLQMGFASRDIASAEIKEIEAA